MFGSDVQSNAQAATQAGLTMCLAGWLIRNRRLAAGTFMPELLYDSQLMTGRCQVPGPTEDSASLL